MRIIFLTPPDSISGGLRVVVKHAQAMAARGHDARIVANARPWPSWRDQLRALRHGKLRETRQRARPIHGLLAQSGLPVHTLDRARPIVASDVPDADVVVATWWETAVWMAQLPASKGVKVHLVQGYETWGDPAGTARVHAALQLPNLKVAISSGLKRDLEVILGDLGMAVVPNAVDLAQFDAPPRARNHPPRIGFIYAQTPIKAVDRCLAVVERVRQRIPDLQVLAFGAEHDCPEMPLPDGTEYHWRPRQDDIAALYARCDAWLFATRIDSFGLPVLEAMACRTPVVGLPVGAAPDLLADGAGVLVSPSGESDLPDAMAEAVVNLLQGPESAWQAMSERAHARAHAYSWNDASDRLATLIHAHVGA